MRAVRLRALAALVLMCVVPVAPASAQAPGDLDYQLGPGDMISISVSGLRNFQQSTQVSNSGRVRVPFVGIMYVAGKTALDLEREIARSIKEHELINEPSVRVHVDRYRSKPTYVIGAVNAPGQFVVTGEMYLLDLLSKAGGTLPGADNIALFYRRNSLQPEIGTRLVLRSEEKPDQLQPQSADAQMARALAERSEEVIEIDLRALREGTKPELNIRLEGGDVLFVPRRQQADVYIIGDVKVPGAYTLPRRGEVTAAQAVIYAGGPLNTAKMSNGFLMRHGPDGERVAIPVDFSAILEGRSPDITVRANDIIFIPSSNIKTIGVGLLNLVPRLIQQFLIF